MKSLYEFLCVFNPNAFWPIDYCIHFNKPGRRLKRVRIKDTQKIISGFLFWTDFSKKKLSI